MLYRTIIMPCQWSLRSVQATILQKFLKKKIELSRILKKEKKKIVLRDEGGRVRISEV